MPPRLRASRAPCHHGCAGGQHRNCRGWLRGRCRHLTGLPRPSPAHVQLQVVAARAVGVGRDTRTPGADRSRPDLPAGPEHRAGMAARGRSPVWGPSPTPRETGVPGTALQAASAPRPWGPGSVPGPLRQTGPGATDGCPPGGDPARGRGPHRTPATVGPPATASDRPPSCPTPSGCPAADAGASSYRVGGRFREERLDIERARGRRPRHGMRPRTPDGLGRQAPKAANSPCQCCCRKFSKKDGGYRHAGKAALNDGWPDHDHWTRIHDFSRATVTITI